MRDPFRPPPFLAALATPLAARLSLTTLPNHIHEILLAYLLYHLTQHHLSPILSTRLFPATYPSLPRKTRINWDLHFVSMVQSCLINTLALAVIWLDEDRWSWGWEERVWGYSGAQGGVQGLALGYFLWDFVESMRSVEVQGWGAVGHAVAASVVSGLGFRPFVNYYGLNFVLYELSTPFLNIHWWMDKLGMTGSVAQLINGILLLTTFGGCRLVWGTWQNWNMYNDVWKATQNPGELPVPTWLALSYLASSCVLSLLNFYWFGKMIQAVLKRFEKPEQKVGKDEKQH